MSRRFLKTDINPTKHIKHFHRKMTKSRSVLDRSKAKRVHSLEIVTENWKMFSKIHFLMELISSQREQVIPLPLISRFRQKINLPKPHCIHQFLLKSPAVFDLYRPRNSPFWVGLTEEADNLLAEERRLIQEYSPKLAEFVTRCLMMSVDKRLRLDKIAHFRRDFGLPIDFRSKWVYEFPELFRVVKVKDCDGNLVDYLELVGWKEEWAVTELEKRVYKLCGEEVKVGCDTPPGRMSLAFPMKYPPLLKGVSKFGASLEGFQRRRYLSPYADGSRLRAGSLEFDKRAVAVMHELLSFTLEKRLVTDHLTHFRDEMVMPQKLMRLLLKNFGVFYVSERGQRYSVFLNDAYDGTELIEKCPLVEWRKKVHRLIGVRGKRKGAVPFDEVSDREDKRLWSDDSEKSEVELEDEDTGCVLGEDDLIVDDDDQMDVDEVFREYSDG